VPRVRRLAVLDLGSTSFHLLIADVDSDGGLLPVDRERIMLRLGAAIVSGGRIPDPVIKRVLRAARFLGSAARRAGTEALLPIATSAVRDAENGRAVAKRIGKVLGTPVEILSGSDEARITFEALAARGALGTGRSLTVDLGGGSLELGLGDATNLEWETTLRLGVARIGRELIHSDPPTAVEALQIADRVRRELREASLRIRSSEPYQAVATGGTIRAIGRRAIARRSGKKKQLCDLRLDLAELRSIRDEFLSVSKAERRQIPGVQRRRADLLPAGCIILATLCEELDIREIAISDWGLREGILLRHVES
jgi:exopolyphosphatase/guanosine-5'-triphosphate,3'-diphosphate pyrophosphatase